MQFQFLVIGINIKVLCLFCSFVFFCFCRQSPTAMGKVFKIGVHPPMRFTFIIINL